MKIHFQGQNVSDAHGLESYERTLKCWGQFRDDFKSYNEIDTQVTDMVSINPRKIKIENLFHPRIHEAELIKKSSGTQIEVYTFAQMDRYLDLTVIKETR